MKFLNAGGNRKIGKKKIGRIEEGLINLRGDVENCEYKDVHVMWEILNKLHDEEANSKKIGRAHV